MCLGPVPYIITGTCFFTSGNLVDCVYVAAYAVTDSRSLFHASDYPLHALYS